MRNLLIFMLLVAVFVLGRRSCHGSMFTFGGVSGSGPVQTETRNESNFHAIDLDVSGDLEITVGEQFAVEISAQQNILPLIKTEVKDGALHVYTNENFNSPGDIKIRVTAPAFDAFSVAGSGNLRVMNALRSEKMGMNIAGSGDIFCSQADFNSLSINITGSGGVELGGKANDVKAEISGSGDVMAKNMTANVLKVNIVGSGTVTADVNSVLHADISGSGDVFYSGTASVETNVSGSGSVKKIGAQ